MSRIDDHGNIEFHPAELPREYQSGIDPKNPNQHYPEQTDQAGMESGEVNCDEQTEVQG